MTPLQKLAVLMICILNIILMAARSTPAIRKSISRIETDELVDAGIGILGFMGTSMYVDCADRSRKIRSIDSDHVQLIPRRSWCTNRTKRGC